MTVRMRVLVSGGAGFIGSHVVTALCERGDETLALDNLSTGRRENVDARARLLECDLHDAALFEHVRQFAPEAILHAAAQVSVRLSVEDPSRDASANVLGTVRLLEAAARARVPTLIFSSTGGAIYGEQEVFPAGEDHPQRPMSPYGVAKKCAEAYLDYYGAQSPLRTVALRYANVYGPRQDPDGEAGVVAIFCRRMLEGTAPQINGDGRQTRDYVYVGDVVRANLRALDEPQARGPYNIGTGVETDVLQLVEHLRALTGYRGPVPHGPAKAGEQRRSVLSTRRASRELGWRAETPLAQGLEHTVRWFREARGRA